MQQKVTDGWYFLQAFPCHGGASADTVFPCLRAWHGEFRSEAKQESQQTRNKHVWYKGFSVPIFQQRCFSHAPERMIVRRSCWVLLLYMQSKFRACKCQSSILVVSRQSWCNNSSGHSGHGCFDNHFIFIHAMRSRQRLKTPDRQLYNII